MSGLELQPTSGVVITGGASGIGLATAHAVAEVGRPVAIWDLHPERAAEAADAVSTAHGVKTVGMAVDVRDTASLADAADTAVAAIGTIGGVVHAAGVPDAIDLQDLTDKTWDPLMEVNLRAYAMVIQAFLSQLRANAPDAAVVGIASIHGIVANPMNPAYAASKAGVLGLTRSLAIRFAQEGIRVNAICPGFIETPMLPDIGDLHDRFAAASPMNRLGKPAEIGKTARFLLSTDASFITGTHVVVDGGCTITDMWLGDVSAITATDDELRGYLAEAELPPLLPALAYVTGDRSLLRDDLRPDPHLLALPQGGMSPDQQAEARALALDALIRFRDDGGQVAAPPSRDDLVRIMEHVVGGTEMGDYVPLLEEELALRGDDRRGPQWRKADVAPDTDFRVVVIGAGMSGLLTAYRLRQAGVDFVVIEKNADVGGTWFENTYPGCRVDNPNHNYSYSFAQRHDWPLHYSNQEVLHGYFRDCAHDFGILDHIRFSTEVRSATWDDTAARWSVVVRNPDGTVETLVANAVVSAVGQLNRPHFPDIPGRDSFAGVAFHSAQWDHDAPIDGARVAVIGTGASSVQFTPEIAPRAGHLFLFQRTPPWLGPSPDYHEGVPDGQRWLYAHVPTYSEWNRFWMFWRMGDGSIPGVRVDPDWDSSNGTVSAINDLMRTMLASYLEREFAERPDLIPHVVPTYPPGAKRLLRDNGVWAGALTRDNVTLVTDEIREITPAGIVTADGVEHEVDVIVYGTGFQASNFLTPMRVTGAAGVDLHEQWSGDARAYLGITIPGFPNFFCLYGPNTNIVINGSIIYFSECGVRYILGCIELLLRTRHVALDVRKDVHDEFNEQVDAENRLMAWGWSDVNSWYKNEHGRVAQNWPFTLLEYWQRTLAPDPDDYVVS